MSFIGSKELLRLVKEEKLVENLCERELNNPEGAGFDLRAGEFYRLSSDGKAYLGVENRSTPDVVSVAKYGVDKEIIINPGEYFMVETMERLNTPDDLVPEIFRRSTLQRCGLNLIFAGVQPGYRGSLTFGLKHEGKEGDEPVRIELGARICHLRFSPVVGENFRSYEGQWQDGRVSTKGKTETQI